MVNTMDKALLIPNGYKWQCDMCYLVQVAEEKEGTVRCDFCLKEYIAVRTKSA